MIPKAGDKVRYTKEFHKWVTTDHAGYSQNCRINEQSKVYEVMSVQTYPQGRIVVSFKDGANPGLDQDGRNYVYPNSPIVLELVEEEIIEEPEKQSLSHVTKISKIDL